MRLILLLTSLLCVSCAELKYTATTSKGSESFRYTSFGGSGTLESAGGTRLTQNHNKTAGQFFQAATAIGIGLANASVTKAENASNAATQQQSNAAAAALAKQKQADSTLIELSKLPKP